VLGAIPLLGDVLTSREGEGILGTTYSVSGDADEPEISVNPLSMLTPGILRRIFEGRIPTAKPNAPPPKAVPAKAPTTPAPPATAPAATPPSNANAAVPSTPENKPRQSAINP
jgi:hypothetical protein